MLRTRLLTIFLALCLLLGLALPAGAEVMTLGVSFRGMTEGEDGAVRWIPLSGSFRVYQGGMDRGVIQAGVTTVTLDGSDPATLVPMPETIGAGWDLTGARTTVSMEDGGNVTVPILVRPLTENTVAAVPVGSAVVGTTTSAVQGASGAPQAVTGTAVVTEDGSAAGTAIVTDTQGAAGSAIVTESQAAGGTEVVSSVVGTSAVSQISRTAANQTAVPVAAATPEPQVGILTGSTDTGTFHLKAFYDSNSNGDCSIYEKGVAGIQVYIVSQEGELITGGVTNAEGEITLPGIQPGSYRVRAYLPEAYGFNRQSKDVGLNKSIMTFSSEGNQDSEPIRISAGETVERGIGLLKGVVVDGVCWLDENADGIMNAGEPKIAGARITMVGQKNGLSFEAYSDENGYWRIYRLRAGFYDFTSYAPDGMMFTRYSKTGGKNRSVFTTEGKTKITKTLDLNDGRNQADQNIGFAWQASVSGMAFLDANYNGMYDEGELPLAGVKVTAIKQVKDEEIAVTYTGADGRYTLGGLRGNTYKIRAVLPEDGSNFTTTVTDPLGNHFAARENRRENFYKDIVIQDGQNRTVNVGAIYYGSVGGTVYMDDDFSGAMNGSEKTVQGITVSLLNAGGAVVDTKQTSAKGAFTFTGLTPGKYSLRMTAKEGYAFTRRGTGNIMLNLTGGQGYSEAFDVPLGQAVLGMDAGMIMPGTVKGVVFADRNDNGRRDANEAGLNGARVRLMSEEGEEFSALIGESGEFLFDAVMPGRYYLEYQLPEGAIFARENSITGEEGTGRGEWFDFRTADRKEAAPCGGLTLGRLTGVVFHDLDGSGTMEGPDGELAGAEISLIPARSDLKEITAVTDESGAFALENLHPDTYTLRLTLPEGMVTARTAGITLPLESGTSTQEQSLTVDMGQTWDQQMIGAVIPAALRGRVWLDENNNGLREEGEQTPEGLTITVTDEGTGEVFAQLVTEADGSFAHEGMIPGSYGVSYRLDAASDASPAGDNTFRRDGSVMEMTGITLTEGDAREDLTLGLVKFTAMGGRIWIDRGEGAEALQGAEVRLLDEGGETLNTRNTGEDGNYRFEGLMPGDYRLEVRLPEGTVAVEPDDERLAGGMISVIQETDGRVGRSDLISLIMGQDQLSLNMGGVLPGIIGDYCWLDENGNGWQDGGELGIPHVKVELIRNGVAVAETETDQYGLYFFREIYPAVYTLRVTAPGEVKPTQKRTDIYLIVSSLLETEDTTAYTEEFAVASRSTDFNIDLGYVLRTPGVYPEGYGEQDTQDWSRSYEGVTLK